MRTSFFVLTIIYACKIGTVGNNTFDANDINNASTYAIEIYNGTINIADRRQLRDYQKQSILQIVNHNSVISLPTGSGKTLIAHLLCYVYQSLYKFKHMVC